MAQHADAMQFLGSDADGLACYGDTPASGFRIPLPDVEAIRFYARTAPDLACLDLWIDQLTDLIGLVPAEMFRAELLTA